MFEKGSCSFPTSSCIPKWESQMILSYIELEDATNVILGFTWHSKIVTWFVKENFETGCLRENIQAYFKMVCAWVGVAFISKSMSFAKKSVITLAHPLSIELLSIPLRNCCLYDMAQSFYIHHKQVGFHFVPLYDSPKMTLLM